MMSRIVLGAAMGAVCGSFAAVVAERTPRGESPLSGRSRCRGCDRVIAPRDLVPIVSWILVRGRCRWCRQQIGSMSLSTEVLLAAVFAVCAVRIQDPVEVAAHWILCTGLMALTIIDVRTFRLPRSIVHVTALLGAPILVMASILSGETDRIASALLGATGALAAMAGLYWVSGGRLGDGDVRLSPVLGLYLGWKELSLVYSGFLLSFLLGAVAGVIYLAVARRPTSSAIPFGPFLAAGTLVTLVFDVNILEVMK